MKTCACREVGKSMVSTPRQNMRGKRSFEKKRHTHGPENVPKGGRKDTGRKPSCVLHEFMSDDGCSILV